MSSCTLAIQPSVLISIPFIEPWLEPSPASTIPLHTLTMSAWIHGCDVPYYPLSIPRLIITSYRQTPSAPVSRFTSDVVANAQAGRPFLQLSDVAARTIRKKINPSGGLLHPATWEPPAKQSKRLRSHSNNSVNALGRQLKRTKLADPKARKGFEERVARRGYNLTGDIRSPAGPQSDNLSGPAAVPPPFAVGPISDDVISQYVMDPNDKSSSYGSRSAALTEEQLLALEEDIFGDEDESDYDYDDDEEEDECEYYYESSSSSSSSSGSHKGKGVDPRERPAPQINAQTFPVEAERYETEVRFNFTVDFPRY
jgi:hypothetical protein